jgi:hypothetical protein
MTHIEELIAHWRRRAASCRELMAQYPDNISVPGRDRLLAKATTWEQAATELEGLTRQEALGR